MDKPITPRIILVYAFAALIVSAIAYKNTIYRSVVDYPDRVGVPIAGPSTDLNDNYVYFSHSKRGKSSCRYSADKDENDASGNPLTCSYITAVLINNALYKFSQFVTTNLANALGLLMVLQTALLAFSGCLALGLITGRKFSFPYALIFSGTIVFLFDAFALSLYLGRYYPHLGNIWALEPNTTRMINPTMFWTLGLTGIVSVLLLQEKQSPARFLFAGTMLTLAATSSIAIGLNIMFGIGVLLGVTLLWKHHLNSPFLFAAVFTAIGILWQLYSVAAYQQTELGSQLRHGLFVGININYQYLIFLVPLLFGRIGPIWNEREGFLRALLLGAVLIGVFSESIEHGNRLWIRGAAMIAFILSIAWLLSSASMLHKMIPASLRLNFFPVGRKMAANFTMFASVVAIIAFVIFSDWIRPYKPQSWHGYIEPSKYEAIEWLADHSEPHDTIASTNIEDSILLDFYTRATPFIPLYGINSLPWPEPLRRYFHVMDLIEDGDHIYDRLRNATKSEFTSYSDYVFGPRMTPYNFTDYQVIGFYEYLVYYSYNKATPNLFATGTIDPDFQKLLDTARLDVRNRKYAYRFLLLRNEEHLKEQDEFDEVYRNAKYSIFEPK